MSDVEENATDDLRAEIESALNPVEETAVEETEQVKVEATETTKTERARDEKGKFVKAETTAVEPVTETNLIADGKPAEPTPSEGVPPVVEPVPEVVNPPQAWTAAEKEKFKQFDIDTQKELLRRETDYSKGIQRNAEDAKFGQSLKPVMEHWKPYLTQLGVNAETAIDTLMQAEYTLRHGSPQQKQQAFQKMAQDYGIPLPNGEVQTGEADPNQHIYDEMSRLRTQLNQQQVTQQQEQDRIVAEQETQMSNMITEFSSNPEYPHFEVLRDSMAQLLQSGMVDTLEAAYEQAAWVNPEIRSLLIKQDETKRINSQADIATQAKAKAVSIKGSPSGAETPAAGLDIRGELEAALKGESNRI